MRGLSFKAGGSLVTRALPCLACTILYAVPARADAPSFAVVRQGKPVPISTPQKADGDTVYLSSVVAPAPGPKPTAAPAPITIAKPSHQAKIPPYRASSSEGVTDDPWESEYRNATRIPDPILPVNRGVFWFNHQVYRYAFIPLNKTYKFLFPLTVRTGISNAVNNVEYPVRFVNDLLQWKPAKAGLETEKFLLNSTAGVGGLVKVSNKFPKLAELKPTDTSATFAKWGIPPGCYIVWPLIGPKSVRDTFGFAGDVALNPASWFTYGVIGGLTGTATLAISTPQTVGNTSDKLDTYETITKNSVDPYLSVRSAYVQNRKKVEGK
jgi:phospholipid-binding lipoprotein MlaA